MASGEIAREHPQLTCAGVKGDRMSAMLGSLLQQGPPEWWGCPQSNFVRAERIEPDDQIISNGVDDAAKRTP